MQQISIETAQSKLDCSVLAKLPAKTIILGVLDLSTHEVEIRENGGISHRAGPPLRECGAPGNAADCGMEYLPANRRSER